MPAKYYHARTTIKRAIWKLQRYQPGSPAGHVALFASRRGGSSWIMEVISANPEFRYIAQPFVAYDQLSDRLGPLARWKPEETGIVLVEAPDKAARRPSTSPATPAGSTCCARAESCSAS